MFLVATYSDSGGDVQCDFCLVATYNDPLGVVRRPSPFRGARNPRDSDIQVEGHGSMGASHEGRDYVDKSVVYVRVRALYIKSK